MCSGCTYDASGNLTDDSFKTYAWDPYNKLLSVSSTACGTNGECATYDAFGRMVEFSKDATYSENWYTQAGTVVMTGTTLAHAYLGSPGGGTFLEFGGATDYLHKDWLGNARLASLISGQTVGADLAYAPYGEVYNFIAGSGSDWMFTGDVTQLVSEYLFDTPNREFASSNQGRWLSPDPAGAGWNQYAYATDPLNSVDPSGLACYPFEKWVLGTCAGFLDNGVNFGESWDEFYVAFGSFWCEYGDCGWRSINNGLDYILSFFPSHINNTWSKTFPCGKSAQKVMSAVQGDMGNFADNSGTVFSANFPDQPITMGGQYSIQPGLNNYNGGQFSMSNLVVNVTSESANAWTFTTDPSQHYFDGTVSFSSTDAGNGNVTFSITANANWASGFTQYTAGPVILAGENSTWNHMLSRVQAYCQLSIGN
jgi:RHS repeat-associated protein